MGIRELFRPAIDSAKRAVVDEFVSRLDPSRWTVVRLALGDGALGSEVVFAGPVFGRRLAHKLGVVAVLSLRDDGSYWPEVVPVEGVPLSADESVARAAFVLSRRRPVARGHAFQPSPVWPALCGVCAQAPLAHDRAHAEELVMKALGARLDVRVVFAPDSAVVTGVEVRSAAVTASPPVLSEDDDAVPVRIPIPKPPAWRDLTWAEEQQLRGQAGEHVTLRLTRQTTEVQL